MIDRVGGAVGVSVRLRGFAFVAVAMACGAELLVVGGERADKHSFSFCEFVGAARAWCAGSAVAFAENVQGFVDAFVQFVGVRGSVIGNGGHVSNVDDARERALRVLLRSGSLSGGAPAGGYDGRDISLVAAALARVGFIVE